MGLNYLLISVCSNSENFYCINQDKMSQEEIVFP